MCGARCSGGQGGAAVRCVEVATAGPLHGRLASRRKCTLPHRESSSALRRPPPGSAKPWVPGRHAQPLRCLLLPLAGSARPCTWRLGVGLGGRWRLGRGCTRPRCLDPAACLGPGYGRLGSLAAGRVPCCPLETDHVPCSDLQADQAL